MVLLSRNVYLKSKTQFKSMKKMFIFLELLIILAIGSWLRLSGILSNSFAFTYDVGRDMLAVWDIVYSFKISLIGATTGIPGVFYGPWWYFMLIPFFTLFRGDPRGIALTMSIVGILCIFFSFYFGKRIGNNFLGMSMALFTAVSPYLISLSVQIWNPNIAPLFVLLTFIVLEKIYLLKNKAKIKYFFILGIILALNIDIEILWGILFSLGILSSIFFILKDNLRIKQVLYLILGAFLVFSPRILFEFRHSFLMTKSFIAFLSSKNLEDKLDLYHFFENRVNIHLDEFSKSFSQDNNYPTLVLLIIMLVIIISLYKKASKIIKYFILTSFITILVFYIGTVIFPSALWPHYLVGLPVIYIFLFSVSLYLITKKLKKNLFGAIVLLILFAIFFKPLSFIQNLQKPTWEGNASVYRNQLGIIDYIYREANGQKFKYVVYTPPVFDYTYRYHFKWYGPNKYKYSPTEDANIAYFIIEPDPGYPDRPKWWLEARKSDGRVIKEEKLKGDIIVQTRIH